MHCDIVHNSMQCRQKRKWRKKTIKYLHFVFCLRHRRPSSEARYLQAERARIGWFVYLSGWFVKGKNRMLKKVYRHRLFPLHFFFRPPPKKAIFNKNATDFFCFVLRKSMFWTWDIPTVLYILYLSYPFSLYSASSSGRTIGSCLISTSLLLLL